MSAAAEDDGPKAPHWVDALAQELREIRFSGPRARNALVAAVASTLAVVLALALRLDSPWWAAISGFVVCQSTRAGSLRKGVLRIGGTIAGAAIAFLAMRWIGYNHLGAYVFLLGFTTLGLLGFQVSENSYAWLLSAVTASIVVLSSLEDPRQTFHVAVYRAAEVVIGTLTAFLVTQALSPQEEAPPVSAAPGWSDPFGAQWPALLHALRGGVTVMLIPFIWYSFDFPPIGAQLGVSSVFVTGISALGLSAKTLREKLVERAEHRFFGCFVGGAAALLCLWWPLTEFLPWLLILGAAVWLAAYVQASPRGVGYVGMQFGLVFIMTLVQGFGPPTSIWVGVDRLAGILGAVTLLLLVSVMLWEAESPAPQEAEAPASSGPPRPPAYALRLMFAPRVFDRSAYLERLKQGGVEGAQAELHADALEAALRDCVSKDDLARSLIDLDALREDLLQRLRTAQADASNENARARAALKSNVLFWVFLVALLALTGVVLAVFRLGG